MPSPSAESGRGYVDAHCHLSDPRLDGPVLDAILERSRAAGIRRWILGGVGPVDWARQRELRKRYGAFLYPVYGIHPWWLRDRTEDDLDAALTDLREWLPEAVALGEVGLDYGTRADGIDRDLQDSACRSQLELARETGKPLVIHCVRAHEAMLKLLADVPADGRWRGIVHSFSGGPDEAKRYLELGLALSISGGATKRGFTSLKKAVKFIPPEKLVVETDSPDQPPDGWGAELNEPVALVKVAQAVAAIRAETGEDAHAILARSAENLERIFGIGPSRA